MKKLFTATAVMVLLSSALTLKAEVRGSTNAEEALSTLKSQGITNVNYIERKGDNWFVRYDGTKTKVVAPSSMSGPQGETFMPRHKVSVEELIKRSLADEKGLVSKIEYRNRKLIIKVTNGPDDFYFTYDSNGNRTGKLIF